MRRQPDDVAFDLGLRVRDARFRSRLTQVEVADRAATSSSTVSRMELGRGAGVPLGVWVGVADVVGADLFAGPWDGARIYVDALLRLAEDGGWAVAHRRAGIVWIDRPASRERIIWRVLRPAERAVIRVVPILTDIGEERARLMTAVDEARANGLPGIATEGLLVVVRTEDNIRRTGPSWRRSTYAWPTAIRDPSVRMPSRMGLAWMEYRGTHLLPVA